MYDAILFYILFIYGTLFVQIHNSRCTYINNIKYTGWWSQKNAGFSNTSWASWAFNCSIKTRLLRFSLSFKIKIQQALKKSFPNYITTIDSKTFNLPYVPQHLRSISSLPLTHSHLQQFSKWESTRTVVRVTRYIHNT